MTRPTPRTRLLTIRLTPEELARATAYARSVGVTLSELVRTRLTPEEPLGPGASAAPRDPT